VPELADYRYDPAIELADGGRILTGGERFTLDARTRAGCCWWRASTRSTIDRPGADRRDADRGMEAARHARPVAETAFLIAPTCTRPGAARSRSS
jgi:hypothetical protein